MITRWPCRAPRRPTSKITTYGWSTKVLTRDANLWPSACTAHMRNVAAERVHAVSGPLRRLVRAVWTHLDLAALSLDPPWQFAGEGGSKRTNALLSWDDVTC